MCIRDRLYTLVKFGKAGCKKSKSAIMGRIWTKYGREFLEIKNRISGMVKGFRERRVKNVRNKNRILVSEWKEVFKVWNHYSTTEISLQ